MLTWDGIFIFCAIMAHAYIRNNGLKPGGYRKSATEDNGVGTVTIDDKSVR
jgi:hypothetical protein